VPKGEALKRLCIHSIRRMEVNLPIRVLRKQTRVPQVSAVPQDFSLQAIKGAQGHRVLMAVVRPNRLVDLISGRLSLLYPLRDGGTAIHTGSRFLASVPASNVMHQFSPPVG
jgi:hypothetical protein